jgi:hypothetical protein
MVLFQGGDETVDGFLHVRYRLIPGFALRDAARKTWALRYPITVFARINNNLSHGIVLSEVYPNRSSAASYQQWVIQQSAIG